MSRKRLATALLLVLVTIFIFSGCKAKTPEYEKTEVEALVVEIIGCPNVRSEAFVGDSDNNNSYGTIDKDEDEDIIIVVNNVFKADIDWRNGQFYGIQVEDILSQPEGACFPSGIKKDSDGIVWINHDYVQIIAP
ncbi:hypothetical protein IKG29_02245 [Candidatus Saccharibacteria bacterium]|nr:hypothetical protein [Candidatus Saccharibacteria bacterium]